MKPPSTAKLLQDAFKRANSGAVIALANIGSSQDEAWGAVREEAARRGLKDPTCVLWHRANHRRAFDKSGALVGALVLHWSGDKAAIAALLAAVDGIEVVVPKTDSLGFVVRAAGASVRPGARDTEAVVKYLEKMDLTPEVLLEDAAQAWLMAVATDGSNDARRALIDALHNEHGLPPALIANLHRDEATLVDEENGFHYLNLLARNDRARYRDTVTVWAGGRDWQQHEAAFMLGDTQGRLEQEGSIPLLETLMGSKDGSVVENATRSWLLMRAGGKPAKRVELVIELLASSAPSALVKRCAAANVSMVSEMTATQAKQILDSLAAQKIELEKSDLAYYKKRLKG